MKLTLYVHSQGYCVADGHMKRLTFITIETSVLRATQILLNKDTAHKKQLMSSF